ncbi:MAG: helix-turn-helix domain-containing protein, partial [Bacteroidota bacterium]
RKVARSNRDAVIIGEPGVGKSTVAYAIHQSTKGTQPKGFVSLCPVNVSDDDFRKFVTGEATVPKGATMLFEEIEGFTFLSQLQIVKFLVERKSKLATRVICTMTESLDSLLHRRELNESLGERVKDFYAIEVLPLRDRPEDVPHLVRCFVDTACGDLRIRPKALDVNTLEFLMNRDWKENIRELKAVVEKAVLSSEGSMLTLPQEVVDELGQVQGILANLADRRRFSLDSSLENLERTIIERSLEKFEYNQTRVAEMLGVTEANLRYRLKKFSIASSRTRL